LDERIHFVFEFPTRLSIAHALTAYVAGLTGWSTQFHVHLFHATAPLPPDLFESAGAETPVKETLIERKEERAQDC
jgi:hypothetical protein